MREDSRFGMRRNRLKARAGRYFAAMLLPLGCCGLANGQDAGNQPRLVLQALDSNHDGQLSADEIQAGPKTLVTLDRNGDDALAA